MRITVSTAFVIVPAWLLPVSAQEAAPRIVEGIADNSFFVEEAYNQEPGVVQHILTAAYFTDAMAGPDDESYELTFTQEWPLFTQKHQVGFTVPYCFIRSAGVSENGFGDALLNYRYQAWFNEETLGAFAPRLSLILPSGDEDRGLGDDTVGAQINLPVSTAIGDSWFVHFNAGTTILPDAASANNRDLTDFNLGASGIYAATPTLHFLLEWVGEWNDNLNAGGGTSREFSSIISPGMRMAFNFANDSQLVLGLAVPVGLTSESPDYGVFLYVSFEHFFTRSHER